MSSSQSTIDFECLLRRDHSHRHLVTATPESPSGRGTQDPGVEKKTQGFYKIKRTSYKNGLYEVFLKTRSGKTVRELRERKSGDGYEWSHHLGPLLNGRTITSLLIRFW